MRYPYFILLGASVVALAACVQRPIVAHSSGDVALSGPRLVATLSATGPGTAGAGEAPSAAPMGTARVGSLLIAPADTDGRAKATLVLADALPGAHPWHIHLGSCGNDQGVAGMPGTYPLINVAPDGRGKAIALLPFSTPESKSFFVNVHASAADTTSIACGNLASPR